MPLGRRIPLDGPFEHFSGHCWIARKVLPDGDDMADIRRSTLCLYEDGKRLTAAHQATQVIAGKGSGTYVHWIQDLYFSATDGSDPNANGKTYSYDLSLDLARWDHGRALRGTNRWGWHPRGDYFRARGGDIVPPPLYCNLVLTNKCNLRCEICGSQKALDVSGRRRHMEFAVFERIAETLFPLLYSVELNSQGDPLLYPQITDVLARVAAHRCNIKIQHNGTLLSDKVIDLLLQQRGTITFSLDAVGSRFDEVRRGGAWSKALPGLTRLLRERDPRHLRVGVYPTVTGRTIGEALNVAEWCAEHRVDEIGYHRYSPISGSAEMAPSAAEYEVLRERLREWCKDRPDAPWIAFEGPYLNAVLRPQPPLEEASADKAFAAAEFGGAIFPVEMDDPRRDPAFLCQAPRDYVDIGLEGQVTTCCRAQDVTLGYATSIEAFGDLWLGRDYNLIRRSLQRGAAGPYPLPNCEGCVQFHAPKEAGDRTAIDYRTPGSERPDGLDFSAVTEVQIEWLRREIGHCHTATLPLVLDGAEWELWEDDQPLGPAGALHDEIREGGAGAYHLSSDPSSPRLIGQSLLYFSTSDNTDPRRNERRYRLRRKVEAAPAADDSIPLRAVWIKPERGHCLVAALPQEIDPEQMELWEDNHPLGPGECLHDEIRELGEGRYHIGPSAVYFSRSDNSDAGSNRRQYSLRRKAPMVADDGSVVLRREWLRREQGRCNIAALPLGHDVSGMQLWEDDHPLGPAGCYHDDIRELGEGRYDIAPSAVYFSSSDNTEPGRNRRNYILRPKPSTPMHDREGPVIMARGMPWSRERANG